MRHGTCVTHVPWCMPGSLTRGGGENVPGACATAILRIWHGTHYCYRRSCYINYAEMQLSKLTSHTFLNRTFMHAFTLHTVEPLIELTSPPESTISQSAVHGSVVTKWLGIVCINYSRGNWRRLCWFTDENPKWTTFPALPIFVQPYLFKFWACMDFFVEFEDDIQMMLWTLCCTWFLS